MSVLRNLVLLGAVLAIAGSARAQETETPESETQPTETVSENQMTLPTSPAAARVDDRDVHALERLLEAQSRRARTANGVARPFAFVLAGLTLSSGISMYALGASQQFQPLAAAFVGLGVASLSLGLFTLLTVEPQEDRFARYRLAVENGIEPIEFGRFEGEVRAEAYAMELARRASWMLGLGLVASGGVSLALVAASGLGYLQDSLAWSIPIAVMLVGVIGFVNGLISSQAESEWERYQRGEFHQEESSVSVSVTPMVSQEVLGLSVGGTF